MIFSTFGAYSIFTAVVCIILVFGFIFEERLRAFEDKMIEKIRTRICNKKVTKRSVDVRPTLAGAKSSRVA